jgi:hypothetical protein
VILPYNYNALLVEILEKELNQTLVEAEDWSGEELN